MDQQSDTVSPASVRVMLVNIPAVASAFIARLLSQESNIEFIGSIQGYFQGLLAARQGVDIVLLGAPRAVPMPGICSLFLTEFPHVRIIVIATEQDESVAYYLAVTHQTLTVANGDSLLSNIHLVYNLNTTADPGTTP